MHIALSLSLMETFAMDSDSVCLQVQDLAALMITCREMRTLAAADLHWERLTTEEFDVFETDVINAQRGGWMRLYRAKHLQREAAR